MGYSEEIDGLCRRRGYYDRGTHEDYRRMLESADAGAYPHEIVRDIHRHTDGVSYGEVSARIASIMEN